MSSEIGFPSNLPSVLCFRVLRLSAVSNTIQLTKVHNIIENNAARELQSENDSNSQCTMNAYDSDLGELVQKLMDNLN